jgi:methylated-DNA-[protein]-cysteine S-methyltransferase
VRAVPRTHTVIPSPIGPLTAVREGDVLVGVLFDQPDHPPDPAVLGARDDGAVSDGAFSDVAIQLAEYFAGERTTFDLALHPTGDSFGLAVWEQMTRIPYGETRSYGDLARALGDRSLAQAVGRACGRNPLPVVIPCHRVVGADGSLVGFGGGLDRKRFLLDLEQRGERLF